MSPRVTAAVLCSALCTVSAACMTRVSVSKAIATADFSKTWDQLDAEGGVATQPRPTSLSRVSANEPIAATTEELDLGDGTHLLGVVTSRVPGRYAVLVTAGGEQHMVPWARLLVGGRDEAAAGAVASNSASAPDSLGSRRGTVVLKSGETVTGVLVREEPGQFVTIDLDDGAERTISWDRISEVNLAKVAQPSGAP